MTSHALYRWHHSHFICYIKHTGLVISFPINVTSNTLCLDLPNCISDITPSISVSVWSHLLYRWYKKNCMYDITHSICMAHYALYMTSHPRFMTSQHSIHDITATLSPITLLYLTAHPKYVCHHTEIMDHITPIVCMISQSQYVWHERNYIWHHIHLVWYPTAIWYHTLCGHDFTHSISDITSAEAAWLLRVYFLYHNCNTCDIKPTICRTSY